MKEIIIVGGLGRSGSSLTMKMLHKGGMKVYTDSHSSYECEAAANITTRDTWLSEVEGKAIKVLELHRQNLPTEFKYKIIWLRRDYNEQAKSMIKFLQVVCNIVVPNKKWKSFAVSLKKDEETAFVKIKRWGIPHIIVTFEDILLNTKDAVARMKEFVGVDLDVNEMAKVVMKRPVTCMPDMKVEEFLVRGEKLI